MSRFKLNIEALVRQRKMRLITDKRDALMLDEIIRLEAVNEDLLKSLKKAQAKPRAKKESTDGRDNPPK